MEHTSLSHLYTIQAMFISTSASLAGYCLANQYVNISHSCKVILDFEKKLSFRMVFVFFAGRTVPTDVITYVSISHGITTGTSTTRIMKTFAPHPSNDCWSATPDHRTYEPFWDIEPPKCKKSRVYRPKSSYRTYCHYYSM